MGLGVVTDILVRGNQVIPAPVSAVGYEFRFPVLDAALHDLLSQPGSTAAVAR
jgi:NAD dependent epimerase/dehydratase family enzyme